MIRLALPTEPYWLDLPLGVRLQVRPLTTAIVAAAQSYAQRILVELREDIARRREAGVSTADLPNLDDPDVQAGLVEMVFAKGLARHGALAWTGVEDEFTPENLGKLMEVAAFGSRFSTLYQTRLTELVAEGEGSGPAPNGTGAAGPDIAPAADATASAAPTAG